MTAQITVQLSDAFKRGRLDTPLFKDIQTMIEQQAEDELERIFQFMQDVANNIPLRGKNKPSWLDDNLNSIPNTSFYEDNNIWHYHCGPYANSTNWSPMTELKLNLNGETSNAVIHYQKISDKHIFILAYSPQHIPFPRESDIPNPLLNRPE